MRRGTAFALLLTTLIAALTACAVRFAGVLPGVERQTVGLRFQVRGPEAPDDVAVVAIDDVTFSELELRWPFPRRRHARAIDALMRAGARLVVYDVQFTEPSDPRDDDALYDAVARAGRRLVLVTSETDGHGHTNILGGDDVLAGTGAHAASATLPTRRDGVMDVVDASSGGLETVARVAARWAGGRVPDRSLFGDGGAMIDFRGGPGTVPTYSFSDLLAGRVAPGALRGRVVVVGATAPTLQDVHPTPASRSRLMSGPEIQANAIWTALHGVPLRPAPWWLDVLAILALSAVPALLALRVRALLAAALALPVAAAYLALAQLAFDRGLVVAVAAPLTGLVVALPGMVAVSYLAERHERRRVSEHNEELERLVRARTEDLRRAQLELIERLAQAVESRDTDTGDHVVRMSSLCERTALALGLSPDAAERLRQASALHDLGKIAIPDAILHKPGRLDADEWERMQCHTTIGADLLTGSISPVVRLAEVVARTHHERWDGSGYPAGLAGEEIPLPGRIAAVCDVYDALTAERPYKRAWTAEEALAEIRVQSGAQFDPEVVRAFLQVMAKDGAHAARPAAVA